ncbi:MAG: CmpA/NrtA family ABC transporter substrate-binding protein [Xanthobacteraceae bacterium]
MNGGMVRLKVGYIPLVDAAVLIIAVDKRFAAEEGLDIELIREVSWSNVRDKLNIGLFQAAHLLSPVAIASSLGIGHIRVPILAPFILSLNGNAITVTPALFTALERAADGSLVDPMVSARALNRVVTERARHGADPLTFGMTFPFSNHNYQLRFWMAAGGIDPDEDVRLVVLPPPYMAESLASGQVDGFCVGAPWSSVAVDLGIGRILHFGCDIVARSCEKVLAVREPWARDNPDIVRRLLSALHRAAVFLGDAGNRDEAGFILAASHRLDTAPAIIRETLDGHLKVASDGEERRSDQYLVVSGAGVSRPEPIQAAWLYAQMARWRQAPMAPDLLAAAEAVFQPDLYDSVLGPEPHRIGLPADGVGTFAGPAFDPGKIAEQLADWRTPR